MLRKFLVPSVCLLALNFVATAAPISFPSGFVPFSSIYYISPPDANGNQLVEGNLTDFDPGFGSGFAGIESITPGAPDQQFSDALIQLAPGQWFSNVYVPTAAELKGNFQALPFPIFDPMTGVPGSGQGMRAFAGNNIPESRLPGLFAFEIGPASTATPEPNGGAMLAVAAALLGLLASRSSAGMAETVYRLSHASVAILTFLFRESRKTLKNYLPLFPTT